MARPLRDSSSTSASSSIVAETLRLRAAASAIVVSIWRLIAFRFSCCSFCSSGVIGFLSGIEDESVVFQQRYGIGGEFVEQRISQSKRWLRTPRRVLPAEDVRDIVGSVSASIRGLSDCIGHIFRAVLTNQLQQFRDLTAERAVGVGHVAEIGFHGGAQTHAIERIEQPLLSLRTPGRGSFVGQYFLVALRAECLAPAP